MEGERSERVEWSGVEWSGSRSEVEISKSTCRPWVAWGGYPDQFVVLESGSDRVGESGVLDTPVEIGSPRIDIDKLYTDRRVYK